jgi:hypothetical protein
MPHINNVRAFIVGAQVVHGIAELGEANLGLTYDQAIFLSYDRDAHILIVRGIGITQRSNLPSHPPESWLWPVIGRAGAAHDLH